MLSELKSLLFDLDGTLYVNNDLGREIHLSSCRYLGELKGITPAEAAALIRTTRERLSAESGIDSSLSHACIELGGDLRALHRRFAAELRPDQFLVRDERVESLLQSLGKRFELYVYTNNNSALSARIMDILGLAGMFRRVFTIEDTWRPKPDRETLEMIFSALGRKPAECLFIGDRYDIDLRLPAAMGSTVFLAKSVEELFPLSKLLHEEEL